MKKQIRKGVFETNSSSTHAICIATDDVLNIPSEVRFTFGEFGWERDNYSSIYSKASYLYTCIASCGEMDKIKKYISFIIETLTKYNIGTDFEDMKFGVYSWNGRIEFYIAPNGDGYVDHAGAAMGFVDAVCSNEDKLLHYLFSNKSYIETGNDNDEYDVDINVDYPHEEYYKGN